MTSQPRGPPKHVSCEIGSRHDKDEYSISVQCLLYTMLETNSMDNVNVLWYRN